MAYSNVDMDTLTAGVTILLAPSMLNDFRANWSRSAATLSNSLTAFHGAVVPSSSVLFPSSSPYSPGTDQGLVIFPDGDTDVRQGRLYDDAEQQLNFVDTLSWAFKTHQLKFGIDYRRLTPTVAGINGYALVPSSFALLVAGTVDGAVLSAGYPFSASVNNYSLFAQDSWKATDRLTINYGLRWEINTPPVSTSANLFM